MQAGVEPLRAVGRGHLAGEHEPHFVIIGLRVGRVREITTLPAPIGPGPRQTVEHLLGAVFADEPLFGRQFGKRCVVGNRPPQKFRHALFLDPLCHGRHARLAKVFLRQHVRRDLAPALRHLDGVVAKHHGAVGVADFRGGQLKPDGPVCPGCLGGELALDLHLPRLRFVAAGPCGARPMSNSAPRLPTPCHPAAVRRPRGRILSDAMRALVQSAGFRQIWCLLRLLYQTVVNCAAHQRIF